MAVVTDAELDAAMLVGEITEFPVLATSVLYDRHADRVVVTLTNGCTFAFPPRLAQGLEAAGPEALADVEVLGIGTGLHWGSLDVDLSVAGLLNGRFGSQAYAARGRVSGFPASEGRRAVAS